MFRITCVCFLSVLAMLRPASSEELYFFPQTNLLGQVDHDWFNGDNWFVYDLLGSLVPAGTPPSDNQTAVVFGFADVGMNLVRLGGLALTDGAVVTNGTFGVMEVKMDAGSSLQNTKVNLLGTMLVSGPECVIAGGILNVLAGAAVLVEPGIGETHAELIVNHGGTIRIDGRLTLSKSAVLAGGTLPQSKVVIGSLGVLSSSGTNVVRGTIDPMLLLDHNGLVEVRLGQLEFQSGLEWISTGGANQFQTLDPHNRIDFTGPFRVPVGVTTDFHGPGTNAFWAQTVVEGLLRLGAVNPGNLGVNANISGSGTVQVLAGGEPGSTLNWNRGLLSCRELEIAQGATLNIFAPELGSAEMSGCTLTNAGLCALNAPVLQLSSGAAITNAGLFELRTNSVLQAEASYQGGVFNNRGTLRKVGAGDAIFGQAPLQVLELNNSGLVEVNEGRLKLGPGYSNGEFRVHASGELLFWNGVHAFGSGTRFTGEGPVIVSDPEQSPRWRVLGTVSANTVELGRNSTLEGIANITAAQISAEKLIVIEAARITNVVLVAGAAHLQQCEILASTIEVLNELTATGGENFISNSRLILKPSATGILLPLSRLQLSSSTELECSGQLQLSSGAALHATGKPSSTVKVLAGGLLQSLDSAALTAEQPGDLILDVSGLLHAQQGTLEIHSSVDLQTNPGPGTFLSETNGQFLFSAPFQLKPNATLVLIGAGAHAFSPQAEIGGTVHVGGPHPLTGSFVPGLFAVSGDLAGPGSIFVHGTDRVGSVLDWRTGTLAIAHVGIFPGATALLKGTESVLSGCTFANSGILQVLSSQILLTNNTALVNERDGLLDFPTASIVVGGPSPGGGTINNTGVLRKSGLGNLQLGTTSLLAPTLNNSGLVEVLQGEVRLGSGTSTGEFRALAGTSLTFWDGTHLLNNGAGFTGAGEVNVDGILTASTLAVHATVTVPKLRLQENGTITGPGSLAIEQTMLWTGGSLEGVGELNVTPAAVLTITGSSEKRWISRLLSNAGTTFWDSGSEIIAGEGALFNSLVGSRCEISGEGRISFSGSGRRAEFYNAGTLTKTGAANFSMNADLDNSGRVEVQTGTLQIQGSCIQSGGEIVLDTEATLIAPVLSLFGGTLTGSGRLDGLLHNRARVSPGSTTGTLFLLNGKDYQQTSNGILEVEITGTQEQHDVLSVSGNASLNGVLEVKLPGGFVPAVGATFKFLEASSITGEFSQVNAAALPDGTRWVTRYSGTNVSLVLGRPAAIEDLKILNGNFEFGFQTVSGFSYLIEATETLPSAQWETVSFLEGDGSRKTLIEPVTNQRRYYRVQLR